MDQDLPSDHDVIIIGTGMTESILAAAFSRAEMRVLHMDLYDNYGGKWGAFNFKTFQQLINEKSDTPVKFEPPNNLVLEVNERLINLPATHQLILDAQQFNHKTMKTKPSQKSRDHISSNDKDKTDNIKNEKSILNDATSTNSDIQILKDRDYGSSMLTNAEETNLKNEKDTMIECEGDIEVDRSGNKTGDGEISSDTNKHADKKDNKEAGNEDKEGGDDGSYDNKDDGDDDDDDVGDDDDTYNHCIEDIHEHWRRFNLDLLPKVLYNKGSLVELLISSDVARYCEFKLLNRILTPLNNKLIQVPSSRSEVFSTDCVSLLDKRQLMKFLTTVSQQPQQLTKDHEATPFKTFLPTLNLSPTLQHFIQHAIAMVDDTASTMEGIEATKRYLDSLGRYDGNSSFLLPLYGTGELLQCFCRLSAVFGGIYCLRRTVAAIIVDDLNNIKGVIDSMGQRLSTKWLVMDSSYASDTLFKTPPIKNSISRAILITNKSVEPSKKDALTLCNIPGGDKNIIMHELSSSSMTCPPNYYVVHLTCKAVKDATSDFEAFTMQFFNHPHAVGSSPEDATKPCIIWSSYFSIESLTCDQATANNVVLINGPDTKLDCDSSVSEAERVFKWVCPDLVFLPKAPRPEEIIYGDDDNGGKKGGDGDDDDEDKKDGDGEGKKGGDGDEDKKGDGDDEGGKKSDDGSKKGRDDNDDVKKGGGG